MSDCFDHESDAWDSRLERLDDAEPYTFSYASSFYLHEPRKTKKVKCKHCGKKKLRWTQTDLGWRLVTKKGKSHTCYAYSNSKCTLNKH